MSRLGTLLPQNLLTEKLNPIYTEKIIKSQVIRVSTILCWIYEFKTGIEIQNLEAPQTIEKGNSPIRGNKVLGFFSVKLLLFQYEGVFKMLFIKRSL